MYSFQFLPVLFGLFRSTTAIPQKFDRLSDENISPSKVSFDFNVENSNHSSLDYGSISSPNIIARAIQTSVCTRCPSDSGCANGWHCYMSQGDTACVIPTALLYCSEGYKAVVCGPADTVTTSPWPQDGAKLACLNPGNMFCPTYKTYCSQAKNEWCCGASCGVDGDSCCWNTQTQSEYLCKSGTKCGNNACAPIPTQTAELNAWTAQGCYTDSENARGLPNSYTGADVKIGVCATKAAGFKYFAVEYGVECYWGNELAATSTKGDTSKCDMGCSGFPTAQCGGAGYMNLYLNGDYKPPVPTVIAGVGNFKSIGCMSDPVTPRILSEGSFTDYSGLTVAACIAKAGTAVKYAAVEYWGECYWGNTLASTQSGTCDTPCAGDNNQNCGGSGSAQVYENTAYVAPKPTTTSTTASKTTSTAISITTTSAVSSPTLVPSTGNFKSVGCYTDSAAPRLLSVGSFVDNSGMTVAACAAKAGSSKYFAVEYAVECYWGNELSSAQTSENCNMACAGAATQLCGGGNAATVYQNSNFDEPPTSGPTVLPSSGNWQSSGCYVDSSNPRLLQKGSSTDGALTVAKCIAKAGYVRYIAVEYGSECYWGSVLSSGQKSSACTVACSGESSQLCGGAYAANVYENTEWRPPLSKQEIIDAIREISDYLSTLYESLAALKNAAQVPTRRSIIRKRQEDLEALLTGVQNRARTLSSLFKRRVPQVQEAFELQVVRIHLLIETIT
ncbi:hypothetical protein BKA61DRAFT_254266 [Leptodontidium sp. MPI-SDFR-AT-0119]|nr:hypothetical protein BKA61DRAFT_254266 [Leptodontidium sp. MPI-SDFR-AT-0119]